MEPQSVSSFDLLGKRWSAMIVQDLKGEPRRFRELLSHLAPINDKVLSQRLKELEQAGILRRQVFAEVPIRVEYSLSEKGAGLVGIILEMERWDAAWAGEGRARIPSPAHGTVPITIAGYPNGAGQAQAAATHAAMDIIAHQAPAPSSPGRQDTLPVPEGAPVPAAQPDTTQDKTRRHFWNRLGL